MRRDAALPVTTAIPAILLGKPKAGRLKNRTKLASCLLAIAGAISSAAAQQALSFDVTVPEVSRPSDLFSPGGRPADFLGIGLGQTVNDIRKLLTDQHFSHEDPSTLFLLDEQYFTVEIVASGPDRYLTSSIWSGPEDLTTTQSVRVEFSSPLAGQLSISAQRFVRYTAERGPLLTTLREAIVQKYGPPSFDSKTQMLWFWRGGKLVTSDAHDKQMAISIDTDRDYVKGVTYSLVDDAARQANWDQIDRFQKSVADGAKQVRDAHATAPKL